METPRLHKYIIAQKILKLLRSTSWHSTMVINKHRIGYFKAYCKEFSEKLEKR